MRLSLEWLESRFEAPFEVEDLANCLMRAGFELEAVEWIRPELEGIITGRIIGADPHPNADRLRLCQTDIGRQTPLQVITAAPNLQAGDIVPVALVGTRLPNGTAIAQAKMRGADSFGMYCSASELGLNAAHLEDRQRIIRLFASRQRAGSGGAVDGPTPTDEPSLSQIEEAVDACFDYVMVLPSGTPVGQPMAQILRMGEAVLDIAIGPNRGDCLSVNGLSRELSAFGLGLLKGGSSGGVREASSQEAASDFRLAPEAKTQTSGVDPRFEVRLPDEDLCPLYMAQFVHDIRIGPAPAWLASRVELAGVRSINNVVDALNYVMLEAGQPLHAFDVAKVQGNISARRALAGEAVLCLDECTRTLDESVLVIADENGPIAIAGVIGGKESGVSENTRDILIEAAYFLPASVRMTSKKYSLQTESSYRFERGVDPEALAHSLEAASRLVITVAGGQKMAPPIEMRKEDFPGEVVVPLRPMRTERLIGIDLSESAQFSLLERLGFEPVLGLAAMPATAFRIPGWRRHDVTREIDLIEEVARLHGYDQVPETLPPMNLPPPSGQDLLAMIRPLLRGVGCTEVVTTSLTKRTAQERVYGPGTQMSAISLAESLGDMEVLRISLLPNLLEVARANFNHGAARVSIFEVGKVFRRELGVNQEALQIGVLIVGDLGYGLWKRAPEALQIDYFWAKGLAESLLGQLGFRKNLSLKRDSESGGFHPGRAALLMSEMAVLARFGEIDPRICAEMDFPERYRAAAILFYPEVIEAQRSSHARAKYSAISRLPASTRDLAIVVDQNLPTGDVLGAAQEAGGAILESAKVFDRYQGPQVAAGKVSLALAFRYRSPERTLTDSDVDAYHRQIVERLQEKFGATLR